MQQLRDTGYKRICKSTAKRICKSTVRNKHNIQMPSAEQQQWNISITSLRNTVDCSKNNEKEVCLNFKVCPVLSSDIRCQKFRDAVQFNKQNFNSQYFLQNHMKLILAKTFDLPTGISSFTTISFWTLTVDLGAATLNKVNKKVRTAQWVPCIFVIYRLEHIKQSKVSAEATSSFYTDLQTFPVLPQANAIPAIDR